MATWPWQSAECCRGSWSGWPAWARRCREGPHRRSARGRMGWCVTAAHRAVDSIDGQFACIGGCVTNAGQVHGMFDGRPDGWRRQSQHGAQTCGHRRTEQRTVIHRAVRRGQANLYLIRGGDAADQVDAAQPGVLAHGHQSRDDTTGMGGLIGADGVVELEVVNGDTVGEGGPLGENVPSIPKIVAPGVVRCARAWARTPETR